MTTRRVQKSPNSWASFEVKLSGCLVSCALSWAGSRMFRCVCVQQRWSSRRARLAESIKLRIMPRNERRWMDSWKVPNYP